MLTAAKPSSEPYANPTAGVQGGGERIYRHVNERIRELERTYDFGERFEEVRLHGTQFIVAPGHARPEVESIVERRRGYWIIDAWNG